LARRDSRRKRKRRQASRPGAATAERRAARRSAASAERDTAAATPKQGAYGRSEAKNIAAREALVPLAEGEKPRVIVIGAIVAAALALGQLPLYLAGVEVRGDKPALPGFLFFIGLLLVMAWGMWNLRYWAVLGFQALLALTILIVSLVLMTAANAQAVLVCLAIIVPACAMFWFMVKALARIQMPERNP
jgi:hypothetical protein